MINMYIREIKVNVYVQTVAHLNMVAPPHEQNAISPASSLKYHFSFVRLPTSQPIHSLASILVGMVS